MHGILLVNKPKDISSREVCLKVRDAIKILEDKKRRARKLKVGTTGTLDPHATGLLILCIGEATKLISVLQRLDKEYIATMRLHRDVSEDELKKVVSEFTGEITQLPPRKSAVARKPRKRKIYRIEILERRNRDVVMKIGCEAGTYIRKLVADMGEKIGGAHLQELHRTKVGYFSVEDAFPLEKVMELAKRNRIKEIILPVEEGIRTLKKVCVKRTAVKSVLNGSPIYKQGILSADPNIEENETIAVLSPEKKLLALGIYKRNFVRIDRVLKR